MGQRKAEMGWLDGCCRDVLALKATFYHRLAGRRDAPPATVDMKLIGYTTAGER